jgi:DNA-binding SARP family transcriptional activator/class 3 adenylate cyclase
MAELPRGTLTLLFSDLEDSTGLLQRLGPTKYGLLLSAHRTLVTQAVSANAGSHVDTQGDSFFCVFRTARDAISAAMAIQRSHRDQAFPGDSTVRVRIGLHTGEPVIAGDRYVGLAVHRAARIMGAAHGGQILASGSTADLIADEVPAGVAAVDLGEHRLKGLERPERLYELRVVGLDDDFPPPRTGGATAEAKEVASVDVRILGPLEVRVRAERLAQTGEKGGALLALLLLNANRVVGIDQLIDELWGEEPPGSGAKAVQVRVSQLRKTFAEAGMRDLIVTHPPGYMVELAPEELDLHRFERLVSESDVALAAGDPAGAAQLLREALGLWRGTPLAEFAAVPFARTASARLEELRLAAIERRVEADLRLGRHSDLVGELESLVAEHPFRERLRAQLMLALYRSGRQADALAAYRATRHELREELGIEPNQALQELERRILQQDPELTLAPAAGSPAAKLSVWETPTPERAILVAPTALSRLPNLIAVAEPLSKRPRRELIVCTFVETGADLPAATAELEGVRAALTARGVPARAAAFTSGAYGDDVVRLASEQDVDLLIVDAPADLLTSGAAPPHLARVWQEAPCDVVVSAGGEAPPGEGPVVVPFGGGENDWAAVEIGAWVAAAHEATLQLVGSAGEPALGKRDASRSLALVSLVVQRTAGISAKPVLVASGEELLEAAKGAGMLLLGLSERWSEEGLGAVRLALAREAGVPTLLVRKGLRPGALTPPERMTRYTWSFAHAGAASGG